MGIRESIRDRIEKLVSSSLNGWVQGNVEPALNLHLSGAKVEMRDMVLEASNLNAAAMASSPLLLLQGNLQSLELGCSLYRTPVVTLVVRGLKLVLRPRPSDDVWWEGKKHKTEKEERDAAIAAVDPQGAAAHAAAEQLAEVRGSNTFLATFLASFALSSFRLEFHDCSAEMVTHAQDGVCHCLSMLVKRLVLEEGFGNGFGGSGGFFGAAVSALVGAWSGSTECKKKFCQVEGMGFQVEVRNVQRENGEGSVDVGTPSFDSYPSSPRQDAVLSTSSLQGISTEDASRYLMHLQIFLIVMDFQKVQLRTVEVDVPSLSMGIDAEELVSVTALVSQLHGVGGGPGSSSHLEKLENLNAVGVSGPCMQKRTASELWRIGFEKAIAKSSRSQLTQTLLSGILRRRYASLYQTWLMEVGWGQEREVQSGSRRARRREEVENLQKLYEEITELGRGLPPEAVALARRAARCNAAAVLEHRDVSVAGEEQVNAERYIWPHFRKSARFVKLVLTYVVDLVQKVILFVKITWHWIQACWTQSYKSSSTEDQSRHCRDDERICTPSAEDGAVDSASGEAESRFEDTIQSVVRNWVVAYELHVAKSSFTFTCAGSDLFFEEGIPKPAQTMMPAVRVCLQQFSFAYGSDVHATGAHLACGSVLGELLSVVPEQLSQAYVEGRQASDFHETFVISGNRGVTVVDQVTFLSSEIGPAESQQDDDDADKNLEETVFGSIHTSHDAWRDLEVDRWAHRPWGLLNVDHVQSSSGKPSRAFSSILTSSKYAIRPFLVAEFETKKWTGEQLGYLICYMVDMGRLKCYLECSFIMQINPLVNQFLQSVNLVKPYSNQTGVRPPDPRIELDSILMLDDVWDHYSSTCVSRLRKQMMASIPSVCFQCSIVVECPTLRLSAFRDNSDVTPHGDATVTDGSRKVSLVFDFGRLELRSYPAQFKEGSHLAEEQVASTEELGSSTTWWTHVMKKRHWLVNPPAPDLSRHPLDPQSRHETTANNLLIRLQRTAMMLDIQEHSQVPVIGPFSMVLQASFCRDECSSLFSNAMLTSAGIQAKVAGLTINTYVNELLAISQLLQSFESMVEAASSRGLGKRGVSARVVPEESVSLSGEAENFKSTFGSQPGGSNVLPEQGSVKPQLSAFAIWVDVRIPTLDVSMAIQRWKKDKETGIEKGSRGDRKLKGGSIKQDDLTAILSAWSCMAGLARIGNHGHIEMRNFVTSFGIGDGSQASLTSGFSKLEFLTMDGGKDDEDCAKSSFRVKSVKCNSLPQGKSVMGKYGTLVGGMDVHDFAFSLVSPAVLNADNHARDLGPVGVAGNVATPSRSDASAAQPSTSTKLNGDTEIAANFSVGPLYVTDGASKPFTDIVNQVASGAEILSLNLVLSKDFQNILFECQGGLLVLQTATLLSQLKFATSFWELLSKSLSLAMPFDVAPEKNLRVDSSLRQEQITVAKAQRSSALKRSPSQKKRPKRASSAPLTSPMLSGIAARRPAKWQGLLFSKVEGLSLILSRSGASGTSEGMLFEVDMSLNLELGPTVQHIVLDFSRVHISGLQGSQLGYIIGVGNVARTPRFTSGHSPDSSMAGESSSSEITSQSLQQNISLESRAYDEHAVAAQDRAEATVPDTKTCILEQLRIACMLDKFGQEDGVEGKKWSSAWQGSCTITGLDIAITTSEIELLRSLLHPPSEFPSTSKVDKVDSSLETVIETSETELDYTNCDIPNGAIVAIRDEEEHLYLAAEEIPTNPGHYHLVSVMHHTLAQEKALFKVRYEETGKQVNWFSLLSLHAKSPDGEMFRVHYLPGSGLAEISSTNDGSWELWQCIPPQTVKDEKSNDLDIHNDGSRVHLVNQKSKCGLAIVDGIPMLVSKPGNLIKLKIIFPLDENGLATANDVPIEVSAAHERGVMQHMNEQEAAVGSTTIPQVTFELDSLSVTLLHEAGAGLHLLPLVRARMESINVLAQSGSHKTRVIGGCNIFLEYFEAQSSLWVCITNPLGTSFFYRKRTRQTVSTVRGLRKTPLSIFCSLKKVEITLTEPSLDACLFLIGVLDLAGPYTIRHSPLSANQCKVDNQLGVDLICQFEQSKARIRAWQSGTFFIRHTLSRRDINSAIITSAVDLYLEKSGTASSCAVRMSLVEPGCMALRTRLQIGEGRTAPGPIIVVDVSRQTEEGVTMTISSMVRIRNASGCPLELRCRRRDQLEGGAVVVLEDGDVIDDATGSFDALRMQGEYRKALSSFTVGNFLLSIRPACKAVSNQDNSQGSGASYQWSDDVKGAKAVHVSGLFEKLHYNLRKSLKAFSTESSFQSSFGTVFCSRMDNSASSRKQEGVHFLVRTTLRRIPLSQPNKTQKEERGKKAVWHKQQELLLLPTIRLYNHLTSSIKVNLFTGMAGINPDESKGIIEESIASGQNVCLYIALDNLFLTVTNNDLGLTSKAVSVDLACKGSKELVQLYNGGNVRELEMEVDFGDGTHTSTMKISREGDGVLQVLIFTKYTLQNDSGLPLSYCAPPKKSSQWGFLKTKDQRIEWPLNDMISELEPNCRMSWFKRSNKLLIRRREPHATRAVLDLESLSSAMEISLSAQIDTSEDLVQLGVTMQLPSAAASNPTNVIQFAPRYIIVNESTTAICICQDGFQDDNGAVLVLDPGERSALHAQVLPNERSQVRKRKDDFPDLLLSVRFRPREIGWDWSGPVCAASLGTFWLKVRKRCDEGSGRSGVQRKESGLSFAVAECQEESASLVMRFRSQSSAATPYRIENALHVNSILYQQKGLNESDILEPGASAPYVWDDLSLVRKLVVTINGAQQSHEINVDKIRPWKLFRSSRQNKGFTLKLPFQDHDEVIDDDEYDISSGLGTFDVGYEVYAEGTTRILRISEQVDQSEAQANMRKSVPQMEFKLKVPLFGLSIDEPQKQVSDERSMGESGIAYVPIISPRMTGMVFEMGVTSDNTVCQLKVQRFDVDVKWQGAPFAAMLRVHGRDRFKKESVLHFAAIFSNRSSSPMHVRYASLLLQALDLNLDEDTLMKLVPFYRSSLADPNAPSRQFYFDRLEIHPVKMIASFLPGNPKADYTSAQETLRALLHSVIKIPSVRGRTVELNGVLLSNALLTYKQLALKCAQHYSWYGMRAIYMAKGSELLPPAFASLFDDTAAASLDVFFDPSSGSIDFQGLTLGMFSLLSKGMLRQGQGGTQRYLGDLEKMMKSAGSNLLFAVVTEVSDNILKGAEANGVDGMVTGFRRGILNVAMEPSLLRSAVVKGGSTRQIKLDRSVAMDEMYVEGYIQGMLDARFKQGYMRVKVVDDQVILKNLPPNTALMEEIIESVKNFLVGEGLLTEGLKGSGFQSMRRLQGGNERRLGPALFALSEQLLVIITIRMLRKQAKRIFHMPAAEKNSEGPEEEGTASMDPEVASPSTSEAPQEQQTDSSIQGQVGRNIPNLMSKFVLSTAVAYVDGRLCRHIPNAFLRRIVSGFLLSFIE